jgi:hypothetical protein
MRTKLSKNKIMSMKRIRNSSSLIMKRTEGLISASLIAMTMMI